MELSIVDQRYEAVNEVVRHNLPVVEVAARYGVARQTVHTWIRRYLEGGVAALADRSHRPATCPHQMRPAVEARVVALRHHNPEWGPARIAHQLRREGIDPVPGRSSIYRSLVRNGLVGGVARRKRREDYRRWERETPMDLWQLDVVGLRLADGARVSVVTGVDDHSRLCVLAKVVERATAHPVCDALAQALRTHGVPRQILTDNGKIFTARRNPHPGETLFDRVCRQNGIEHILTRPYSPTTTGKVERFHRTLRIECFAKQELRSIEEAQRAIDAYVARYNADRPHQSLSMGTPAERFRRRETREQGVASEAPQLDCTAGEELQRPPQPTSVHEVVRKADSAGSFGLANARYSAGRWLAGKFVTVRCLGDIVEVHYDGQLIKAHPRKHAKEKEETMSRQKRTLMADTRKAG